MAPKQSKNVKDGYKSDNEETNQNIQEQVVADPNVAGSSTQDPLVEQIVNSMTPEQVVAQEETLEDSNKQLEKAISEKDNYKTLMGESKKRIQNIKEKLKVLEATKKEEEKKLRIKESAEKRKIQMAEERGKVVLIYFVLDGKEFSLSVPHNTTTGKLRQRIVELLNLKSKTKFRMLYFGNDIYEVNGALGLKALRTIPVPDGATIVLEEISDTVAVNVGAVNAEAFETTLSATPLFLDASEDTGINNENIEGIPINNENEQEESEESNAEDNEVDCEDSEEQQ